MYIVHVHLYELQFRDGSGLIQFNGVLGELYARRHLVPRSAYADVYVYMSVSARARVCVYACARARACVRVR